MTRKRRQMFCGHAMYIVSKSQKESRYLSSPVLAVAFGEKKKLRIFKVLQCLAPKATCIDTQGNKDFLL